MLDGRGDYARAAECLREANAMTLGAGAQRTSDYDPAEHERFVDGLLRVFDRDFFARLAGAGLETRRPVFVFGLPRSGTTLIEQVLASHSRVHGAGELRAGPAVVRGDSRARWAAPVRRRDCVPHLDRRDGPPPGRAASRPPGGDRRAAGPRGSSTRCPTTTCISACWRSLFPRATFIHCRRDLRDVAVSCWMTDFRSIRWANDPEHIASRFRAVPPADGPLAERSCRCRSTQVDYEETVTDLEAVARRLVAACGLEWEPACLEFHRTERPVRTASVTQVRQPVYQRSVARWKNYEPALAELFAAL